MRGAEIIRAETLQETVHRDRSVPLLREWLRLPATASEPPLAIERSRPLGETRGAVILVHGFAQNRFTWRVSGRSLVGALVEQGYDVLNLELRGHGMSRAYGAPNARAFDEYVVDVVRVAEACDRPPFAIGHSLGGGVIVGAATRTPLAGLVHLAGVFSFARHNRFLRGLARLSLGAEKLLLASPARLSTGWAGSLLGRAYSLTDVAGYGLPLAGWVPGSMERELLEERLALGFDWTSVEVWLQMCRWARGEPFAYAEAFRGVDVPLLVMAGDADPLLPPGDARSCYEGSGSADRTFLVMDAFEHGAHFGHVDLILGTRAPEIVWPRILGWMGERG